MEKEFKNVKESLERLDDLQAGQIESFRLELMPDIEMQCRERTQAFADLKNNVDQLIAKADQAGDEKTADEMQEVCNGLIARLLEQNNKLKTIIRAQRDDLSSAMKKVSRGKRVLGSYAGAGHGHALPKVMNITR